MKVFDPGHTYTLANYDGDGEQKLIFMKREGPGYPFNEGYHKGTNCQEVMRVLIDRVDYLNKQVPCPENQVALAGLRSALYAFELRAARRHKRELSFMGLKVESAATCQTCGHIDCGQDHTLHPHPQVHSNTGERE